MDMEDICTTLEEKYPGAHRVPLCIRYDRLSAHRVYSLLFFVLLYSLEMPRELPESSGWSLLWVQLGFMRSSR
jgi:hypothetical protein